MYVDYLKLYCYPVLFCCLLYLFYLKPAQGEKPEAKRVKLDLSSMPNDGDVRRSNRKKFVRGDKSVRMSSTDTLQKLRIEVRSSLYTCIIPMSVCDCKTRLCFLLQITKLFAIAPFDQKLTLDGRRLEGNDKTLAELLLYPNCTIHLQVTLIILYYPTLPLLCGTGS